MDKPLVSIIVNNYNYEQFLPEAIDSAIAQTYPHTEVIVVDDGSTDNSRDIIASYGNRVIPVLKQNGGQASAFNVGFEVSKGEIVFFLDSDDIFYPGKVEEIVNFLSEIQENPNVIISNAVEVIDEKSLPIEIDILNILSNASAWQYLPEIRRKKHIDVGITRLSTPTQAYQFAAKYRFLPYLGMPTSGLALSRSLAEKIFPLPGNVKTSADEFLVKAASLLGTVYFSDRTLTQYRIHGNNNWYASTKKTPKQFYCLVDDFLNSKLETIGKKAVFSYFNSLHAKSYYRVYYGNNCSKELFDLARNVIKWHTNLTTIIFFIKTILLATSFKIKSISASKKTEIQDRYSD